MVVSFSGENSFALRAELARRVAAFSAEHGDIAIERLNGDDATFERLRESLQSAPFLASKKLVILRGPGANKQFIDGFEALLTGLPETTDVIIIESKVDKRSSYYKALKKLTDLHNFGGLDGQDLSRWLVSAAEEHGGQITPSVATYLVERIGSNQQVLASELDKLLLYSPQVTAATVELLTEATPQSQIFDLLEAAFSGDAKRALTLYHDQREQKVDPAQIIAMLTWQLKVLALLKTAENRSNGDIAQESKLSPFTIQKNRSLALRLSLTSLRRLIGTLLRIDVRSKRENVDLDEALQNYLLELVTQEKATP